VTAPDPDQHARSLAEESLAGGDPTGWFERLYTQAEDNAAVVPWDRDRPNVLLADWADTRPPDGTGRRALVVGCGLGRDSEFIARFGFDTVAFDVSETAIRIARQRHAGSSVRYLTADLLNPPREWRTAFDLVVESMTVQALPDPPRRDAIVQVGHLVAPGGTLLVIAASRDEDDPVNPPPWPLTRAEIDAFATGGLRPVRVERIPDRVDPTVRRWRAEFRRPGEPAA
jgi:SAM-dependent methyltransferase